MAISCTSSYYKGKAFYRDAFFSAIEVIDECADFIDEWNDNVFMDTIGESQEWSDYMYYYNLIEIDYE